MDYEYKNTHDLMYGSGPTYRVDPNDGRPFWWIRNILSGGRPMRKSTAVAQWDAFMVAIKAMVKANGGIPDNQVTSIWKI